MRLGAVKVTAYVGALLSQKKATKFVKVPKKGDRTTLTFKDKPLAVGPVVANAPKGSGWGESIVVTSGGPH